jgi:hypothetical protein
MPVLKKLEKSVKRIEQWQEECASLQYALRVLLSESGGTSSSDVAMRIPDDEEEMKETDMLGRNSRGEIDTKASNGRVERLTPIEKRNIKALKTKQRKPVYSEAEGEEENVPESEHKTIEYTTPKPVIIKKTKDILKSDARLQELLNNFYKFRDGGNIGKSDELKTVIDEFISFRGLDPITVYASYNFIDQDNEFSDAEDEPEEDKVPEEPEEGEEDEDETVTESAQQKRWEKNAQKKHPMNMKRKKPSKPWKWKDDSEFDDDEEEDKASLANQRKFEKRVGMRRKKNY